MNTPDLKILIVDDTEDQFIMLRHYLKRTLHQFATIDYTPDYDSALRIILRHEYDFYLIDYYLGHRDGLELIQEAIAAGCTEPMVLMTGATDYRIVTSAIRNGAIDYLDKNEITPSSLERAIRYGIERSQVLNALRESEERYRDLFENSAELIQSVDEAGRFEYVNRAWREALGYSEEEVKQLTMFDVIHPDHHEHCVLIIRQILSGEVVGQLETIFVTHDKRQLIVEGNINLRRRRDGSPATRGIFRDVTERRKLEAAEHDQRILAEALRDTAAALNSTLDFDEIMDRILSAVVQVVPHDSANIMLIESGLTHFARIRDYTDRGFEKAMVNLRFIVAETPSFNQVYETGQPLIIPDVKQYTDWVDEPESNWIGSYAALPIQRENKVIGFLNLNSVTPNAFSAALVSPLQAFSNQIALAVENARLYQQAKELAATQERQRLAHELHDTVNQTLFATSITAEALTRLAQDTPPHIREGLVDVQRLTRRAMAGMRSLLLELRPSTLLQTSLEDLMHQITETFTGRSQIEIKLNAGTDFNLPDDVKLALYRMTQETLNHIIQHSKATEVTISLEHAPTANGIELSISDNSRGFDHLAESSSYPDFTGMADHLQAIGINWQFNRLGSMEVKIGWQPVTPLPA